MSRSFCRLKKPVGHGDTESKCLSNLLQWCDLHAMGTRMGTAWLELTQ